MKKVAVTGGISSGKSTACRFFKELGAYVVSADQIVHELLLSDAQIQKKVCDLLGPDVLVHSALSKKAIAEKVFPHKNRLESLEKILHPPVFEEIQRQYDHIQHCEKYSFFVAEVPLLYKTDKTGWFDAVVEIKTDKNIRFSRTPLSLTEFTKRDDLQDVESFTPNFSIENNGSLEQLQKQITNLTHKLA